MIIIAHRFRTVHNGDIIYHVDEGNITQGYLRTVSERGRENTCRTYGKGCTSENIWIYADTYAK